MGRNGAVVRTREIRYDALPSQKEFHNLTSRYKGFSGPIGSGKSMALCQEAIRLSYLNPGRLGLLGAPTYPMLRDATQSTLFEILESNGIPYDLNKAENTMTLMDTKSRIVFRPVDEFERLRGTNLAWYGLDELTYSMEEAWVRLEGRLRDPKAGRLCGFAVWTPKGFDWVYRRFIAKPPDGYQTILAKPAENRYVLSRDADFYNRLKESYDSEFYRQEVLGEYLSFAGGAVYTSFDRTANLKEGMKVRPELPLRWSMDFNVDPLCSVVAQVDGAGIRVLDEIYLRHATTEQACDQFLERYKKHAAGVIIHGDASGWAQHTSGCADYDVIKTHFQAQSTMAVEIQVERKNSSVKERVMTTNRHMKNAAGEVRLWIDPKCRELIQDLEQVSYRANSVEVDKDSDRMRTHMSDALGYLVWQSTKHGPQIGERQERLFQ